MANITITNVDNGGPVLSNPIYEQDTITFAGADVLAPGTILARDSVSKKLVIFVKGGSTNENGIPKAITTLEVTATGAGDITARVATAGEYRLERLIIDADASATNIDKVVIDQLRDYGLKPLSVENLSVLDNQ